MNTCVQCKQEHNRRGIYCSKKCNDKAYRSRKRGKVRLMPSTEKKVEQKEIGVKTKWCNFCGASIDQSEMLQFCSKEHQKEYNTTVKKGGMLKIKLDSKTIIQTKKYDRVQNIIESMINRDSYSSFFR